jgi:hypothetical protein
VERSLRPSLTSTLKETFKGLLEALKALPDNKRVKLKERHEAWVEGVRAQVDLAPTSEAKRVVNGDELKEMLKLASEMRLAGNASFGEGDFRMATVRYAQVATLLEASTCVAPEDQAQLAQALRVAARNQSLACLKTWEWSRAARACTEVKKNAASVCPPAPCNSVTLCVDLTILNVNPMI